MRRTVFAAVLALAGAAALGHGASRGLHLHVQPDPAAPGGEIVVRLDASEPLVRVRLAIASGTPSDIVPERPARRFEVRLRVPNDAASTTVNVHAEGRTKAGDVVRASAIVSLSAPTSRPAPE